MEDWLGRIPASDRLDQPNSAVFVHEENRHGVAYYSCRLCSACVPLMSSSSTDEGDVEEGANLLIEQRMIPHHIGETIHKQRVAMAIKKRTKVLKRAAATMRFTRDAKRFRSADFEACIGRYVLFGPTHAPFEAIEDIEERMDILVRSDPLVQLELALWKVACESNPPDGVVTARQWKAWYLDGWKENKDEARTDPLMNIPALVAPFLGLAIKVRAPAVDETSSDPRTTE